MVTRPPAEVRALSLWRPWPWLVLHARKDVENRTWPTRYRGPLILHAAHAINRPVLADLTRLDLTRSPNHPGCLDLGFVGIVTLTGMHSATDCRHRNGPDLCSPWAEPDGWHWRLTSPHLFTEPIPGPGSRRLFAPPIAVTRYLDRFPAYSHQHNAGHPAPRPITQPKEANHHG